MKNKILYVLFMLTAVGNIRAASGAEALFDDTGSEEALDTLEQAALPNTKKKKFMCSSCSKSFARNKDLERHNRIHTGERPYACKHKGCGKSFVQDSNLKTHMLLHQGVRPYVCKESKCGKAFSKNDGLKKHMLIHTNQKSYVCKEPGCGKTFRLGSHLKAHMTIHTGEKSFKCLDCGKFFRRNGHLKDHIQTHATERHYVCEFPGCGKDFVQRTSLTRHVKKVHSIQNGSGLAIAGVAMAAAVDESGEDEELSTRALQGLQNRPFSEEDAAALHGLGANEESIGEDLDELGNTIGLSFVGERDLFEAMGCNFWEDNGGPSEE